MPDTPSLSEALARADHNIRAGEQRITTQTLFINRMRRRGRDTAHAERLLRNMQVTLQAWHAHRDEILRELAREDKPPAV
jgi:hypothetical protein